MAPADSYYTQHMLIRYWRMIASGYTVGWYQYQQFKKRAANPVEAQVNSSRLDAIDLPPALKYLTHFSPTESGRDFADDNFKCISSIETI